MFPLAIDDAGVLPPWVTPLLNVGTAGFVLWWLAFRVIPQMREDRKADIAALRQDRMEVVAAFKEEAALQRAHDAEQTRQLREEIRNSH